MTAPRQKDIFYNVALPLAAGCLLYALHPTAQWQTVLKNYLPDALWAYAFFSCMLIIWQRRINFTWILITVLVVAVFELLQSKQVIGGTGDIADLVVYLIFGAIALFINKYFILKFKPKSKPL
jgi:hypothetical protein